MTYDIIFIALGILIFGTLVFLISKNPKHTFHVVSGWVIYEAYNSAFDFLLWPMIQNLYGLWGIISLTVFALLNNLVLLLWYHKNRVDWLGVKAVEDMKEAGHVWAHKVGDSQNSIKKISLFLPAKILHFIIWLFHENDIFAFVTLSTWQDSFITTIFLRHGKFDRLNKRDYMIFVLSTILSCLVWSTIMQVAITGVKLTWGLF
jgi:hypothetical protein